MLARDTAQAKNAQAQQARYKELFNRGLIPRDQYETQAATASAARGDARRRSVAGRERPAEPAVHDDHGADLRPHRRAGRARRATWFARTTRRRWSSSTRSRRSTCRSRCRAGICRHPPEPGAAAAADRGRSKSGEAPGAPQARAGAAGAGVRSAGARPATAAERRRSAKEASSASSTTPWIRRPARSS